MDTIVTLNGVRTTDADPMAPKHVISAIPGEDTATVTVTLDSYVYGPFPSDALYPSATLIPGDDDGELVPGEAVPGEIVPGQQDARFRAVRMMADGNARNTGKRVGGVGVVCGLDRVGPNSRPLNVRPGTEIVEAISYAEIGGGDRDVTINVYALHDIDGWT